MSTNAESIDDGKVTISRYAGERETNVIMSLIDEELSEPYTVYTYRYFLNQWPELCFLAYRMGKAVGVVICKIDQHFKGKRFRRGYIGMLSVQPVHRGKGIATRLLKIALAEMVNLGAQEVRRGGAMMAAERGEMADDYSQFNVQIVLETETDNVSSLRLYENLGFIREKRLFNFYLNGKDCFRLILEIPSEHWVEYENKQVKVTGNNNPATPIASSRVVTLEQASPPRNLFDHMHVT